MFGEILQKFADKSPITVMVRGLLENLLNPEKIDRWFDYAKFNIPKKSCFRRLCHCCCKWSVRCGPAFIPPIVIPISGHRWWLSMIS